MGTNHPYPSFGNRVVRSILIVRHDSVIRSLDDLEGVRTALLEPFIHYEGDALPRFMVGEQVALARAIINRPRVLLFDEPLSNLDAKLREQMRLEIRRIQKTFGITSIYVTHDQAEAMTVSDRIVVMNEGRIQQVGTPFEIYSRPAEVEERTDERITVRFGTVSRTIPGFSGDPRPGETVLVVVRPESLSLNGGWIPEKEGGSALNGTIATQVYLGPSVEYEITREPADSSSLLQAVSYNPVETGFFQVGEKVHIDFTPQATHIVPTED